MAGENPNQFGGGNQHVGFDVGELFAVINEATKSAKAKLLEIKNLKSAVSIGHMFDMQLTMQHLSQLAEMCGSLISASNQALMSMARGIKQ